jgi:hypothetical protein
MYFNFKLSPSANALREALRELCFARLTPCEAYAAKGAREVISLIVNRK